MGKKAESDLRSGTVVRRAKRPTVNGGHADGFAGLGSAAVDDVAGEDPGMPRGHAIGRFAIDTDFGQRMACRRAMRCSVEGCVENSRMML